MAENDLAAEISSMIFDAALKASTSGYVDGVEAVDRIATTARALVGEMEAENSRLRDRGAELGDALRPFAEMAENIGECAEDDEVLYPFVESANHMLTVRDARKARALLPATGKESDR